MLNAKHKGEEKNIEKMATTKASIKIATKYSGKLIPFEHEGNNLLIIDANKFMVAVTICDTNKRKCIKIEEILVNEEYRNEGIGSDILKTYMNTAKEFNVAVGLWCEKDNKKGYEFYKKIGFKHIETTKDYWFEYN